MTTSYSKIILGTHLFLPRHELRDGLYRHFKSKLTRTSRYDDSGVEIEMFNDQPESWFGVPLYYFHREGFVSDAVEDLRLDGAAIEFKFTSGYRPGQLQVIEQFENLVDDGGTGFIFEAPPAFGKTVCLIKMMEILGRTALVVVPRSNLVDQWIERLTEHSSLTTDEIGVAVGGNVDWEGKKVVVGLVHTIALNRFGRDFKRRFGVVIFDEVDRSVPPQTFAPVVAMFPARYRIGASATMKRRDGLHIVFERHIGQHHIRGRPREQLRPKVLVVRYMDSSGFIWPGSKKLNRRGMILSRLAGNAKRNRLLGYYIKMIYNSDRPCLVLSDRTRQLIWLRKHLIAKGVPEDDIGFYVRRLPVGQKKRGKQRYKDLKQEDRDRAAKCSVVLATYGMMQLGTDIKELSGLVYATPQSETEQASGRIKREMAGKKQPVIVDIVDWHYEDCQRWARARLQRYSNDGLKVKFIEVQGERS